MGAPEQIGPELVERCVALVRELAAPIVRITEIQMKAHAIVAELPKPVDPDLIEARLMCSQMFPTVATTNFIDGRADAGSAVQWTLAGIRRGRELALAARS